MRSQFEILIFLRLGRKYTKKIAGIFSVLFVPLGHYRVLYNKRRVSSEMTKNVNAITARASDLLNTYQC